METMETMSDLNYVKLLKDALTVYLKEQLTEDLVKMQLAEYEKGLRPIIEKQVNQVTLTGIKKMSDVLRFRDELKVYLSWDDRETIETIKNL